MSNNMNDDYGSYDSYLKNASQLSSNSVTTTKTTTTKSVSNSSNDYGSYDDYLKNNAVTPDEGNSYTGGYDSVSSDNRCGGDITAESSRNEGLPSDASLQSDNVLLQDGGNFGASGFSEGGGLLQNAKGAIGGAANGIKNAFMGGLGSMFSMLKNPMSKASSGVSSMASNLGIPVKALVTIISLLTGGSIFTIASLFSGGDDMATRYSDYSNCNKLDMIDDYKAVNGKGDNWKLSSAQGVAKSIYTALASDEPVTFETMMWDGSTWVDTTVTNDAFEFSDEVIAGLISNAYGESKVRPDCYEMDYLVHNLDEKHADGSYKWIVGDVASTGSAGNMSDFILGRTHHSNWDNYVTRMFELYGASGMGINQAAYEWRSEAGMPQFSSVAVPGLSGLYPGVGLWQWTGQRAYDLSRFADIQKDPVDNDQDGSNDVMYTLNGQLAFLYLENYGDFRDYGVSDYGVLAWGREQKYDYRGNLGEDDGFAYKNLSYSIGDDTFAAPESEIDIRDNVFRGQQQETVDSELDTWDAMNDDITVIRFPKFVVEVDGGIIVGDGSGEEYINSSSNKGNIAEDDDWTDDVSITTYMVGQDNQVQERFAVSSEEEAEQSVNPVLKLSLLYNGLDDKGYWSVTAEDLLAGGDATYRITAQKTNGSGEGNPSRKDEEIRIGREFNDRELDLLKDLYEIVEDKLFEDGQWYHTVSLVLKKDSVATTGENTEWRSLHNDMSAFEGENAKFIGRDLRIAAGAEASAECALHFYNKWEGLEGNIELLRSHTQMSGSFYMLMQTDGWESDNEYAHSILNMVDENLTNAGLREMHATYTNMGCDELSLGFDGIAEAAVSWAWPKDTDWYDVNDESTMDGGGDCYWQTKCTSLYIAVKDVVEPGDVTYYSSCCRGVSTAVRASGADDDMVLGGAKGILDYCRNNPDKWQNLGMITSTAFLQTLEPGDLLLSEGHVMIFVGPEIPLKKWPGGAGELSDCELAAVHASRSSSLPNSRGPRCDNSCEWIVSDSKTWYAYRCISYESSSKWKSLVESMNFSGLKDGSEDNH